METTETTQPRQITMYVFLDGHTGEVLSAVFASEPGWQQMMSRRRAYYKGRDVRIERRTKIAA